MSVCPSCLPTKPWQQLLRNDKPVVLSKLRSDTGFCADMLLTCITQLSMILLLQLFDNLFGLSAFYFVIMAPFTVHVVLFFKAFLFRRLPQLL